MRVIPSMANRPSVQDNVILMQRVSMKRKEKPVAKYGFDNGADGRASWDKQAKKLLEGRTITGARYFSAKEAMDSFGWDRQCVCMSLDNGSLVMCLRDAEGNGPGALFVHNEKTDTCALPVIG